MNWQIRLGEDKKGKKNITVGELCFHVSVLSLWFDLLHMEFSFHFVVFSRLFVKVGFVRLKNLNQFIFHVRPKTLSPPSQKLCGVDSGSVGIFFLYY